MFSEGIGDDIVGTLMLWEDLFGLVSPSDVVMFEIDMTRFGRDDLGSGEFDCRGIVFKHDRRLKLWITKVGSKLAVVYQGFCCSRECDVFSFCGAERDSFFFA